MFPKRIHLRLHEFGLNSNDVLEILGLAQFECKFVRSGNVFLGIAFQFFPKSVPPDG